MYTGVGSLRSLSDLEDSLRAKNVVLASKKSGLGFSLVSEISGLDHESAGLKHIPVNSQYKL